MRWRARLGICLAWARLKLNCMLETIKVVLEVSRVPGRGTPRDPTARETLQNDFGDFKIVLGGFPGSRAGGHTGIRRHGKPSKTTSGTF